MMVEHTIGSLVVHEVGMQAGEAIQLTRDAVVEDVKIEAVGALSERLRARGRKTRRASLTWCVYHALERREGGRIGYNTQAQITLAHSRRVQALLCKHIVHHQWGKHRYTMTRSNLNSSASPKT